MEQKLGLRVQERERKKEWEAREENEGKRISEQLMGDTTHSLRRLIIPSSMFCPPNSVRSSLSLLPSPKVSFPLSTSVLWLSTFSFFLFHLAFSGAASLSKDVKQPKKREGGVGKNVSSD